MGLPVARMLRYERFQQHTPHSIILPLSEEFVAYLNADGIELPKGDSSPLQRLSPRTLFLNQSNMH
eukprot:4585071-Amphidinium_carterae.1